MAFAGAIMVFYISLFDGYMQQMQRTALNLHVGEIQIHAAGYRKDPDIFRRVQNATSVVERLEAKGYRAAPRLFSFALAAAGSASSGVQLRGVDVAREKTVTRLHDHLRTGAWVDPAVPDGVVVGRKLARALNVSVGDEVVVVGQGADGSTADRLFKIRGVLRPVADDVDRAGFFIPESTFREMLVVPDGAHEIVVVGAQPLVDLDAAVTDIASVAESQEVLHWKKLQPVLARMIELSDGSAIFLLLVTYIAVGMVVLNAALMSVFERIREFGILKALGFSPRQIGGIVIAESMMQATIASLIALAFGLPLSLYYEVHGLDFSSISGASSFGGIAMEPVWYTAVSAGSVVQTVAMLFVMVLLAAIYPGIKAALIRPVDAIHHR